SNRRNLGQFRNVERWFERKELILSFTQRRMICKKGGLAIIDKIVISFSDFFKLVRSPKLRRSSIKFFTPRYRASKLASQRRVETTGSTPCGSGGLNSDTKRIEQRRTKYCIECAYSHYVSCCHLLSLGRLEPPATAGGTACDARAATFIGEPIGET